ncbi:MAG: NADH-quinone oxidoreductase subunit NuoH [Anaerolineae bacterium]|nr:NADH-quinone oxidoreductase subunit NuoH [Anaerolineae bacterium]MDW8100643.1 NADH-quinone oxidoreductase subunit NuoH [Anaerolineae bacterium]
MEWVSVLIISLIKGIVILLVLLGATAYLTLFERKLVARFQVRYGPNRAGKFGILQPIADVLKLMFKEEVIPSHVDKPVYLLAPILAVVPAFAIFAVVPMGPDIHLFGYTIPLHMGDVNVALLYVLAIASVGTYGVMLGGWASNNNFALLGALRTSAQMISYELPLGIFLASLLLLTGTFSLVEIVYQPRPLWAWIWLWLAFPFFFICMLAETNRSPFDFPETENELIAGYQTEYGGIKFGLFYLAEYLHMITSSAIMATLFFGGWRGPFAEQFPLLGIVYLGIKVVVLLFLFVWVRASIPRVRYDQLMHFGWRYLLPISLIYLAITSVLVVTIS